MAVLDQFLRHVVALDPTQGECWQWTGATASGYGRMRVNKRGQQAHRVAYELFVAEIPEGFDLDHLCRNRGCVNPDHLEPVTRRENLLRGETIPARNARITHCPQGHPYDAENTRIRPCGRRRCAACNREAARRWRAR